MSTPSEIHNEQPIGTGIKEHIDKNANLYTVFGIMNALTIYASSVPDYKYKHILPFLFLSLSLLLWLTIRFQYHGRKSFSLVVYLRLLDAVFICLFVFWAQQTDHRKLFLIGVSCIYLYWRFGEEFEVFLSRWNVMRTDKGSLAKSMTMIAFLILSAGIGNLLSLLVDFILSNFL